MWMFIICTLFTKKNIDIMQGIISVSYSTYMEKLKVQQIATQLELTRYLQKQNALTKAHPELE